MIQHKEFFCSSLNSDDKNDGCHTYTIKNYNTLVHIPSSNKKWKNDKEKIILSVAATKSEVDETESNKQKIVKDSESVCMCMRHSTEKIYRTIMLI